MTDNDPVRITTSTKFGTGRIHGTVWSVTQTSTLISGLGTLGRMCGDTFEVTGVWDMKWDGCSDQCPNL